MGLTRPPRARPAPRGHEPQSRPVPRVSSRDDIKDGVDDEQEADPTPTRPLAFESTFVEDGDAISICMREGSRGRIVFLTLWLAGWTVACVALAWTAITSRQLFPFLFGLPFWSSWVFAAVWITKDLYGLQTVSLDPVGLAYERSSPAMTTQRFVPLEELRGIESRVFFVDDDGEAKHGIEIRTLGRSITIATARPPPERDWLAARLDGHRRRLQSAAGLHDTPEVDRDDCRACAAPTDGTWAYEDGFEGPQFVQAGRPDLPAVCFLLFVTLFWNGIVGIFIAAQFGVDGGPPQIAAGPWSLMTLFLIPFEVVGLAMFGGLMAALVEPWRVTQWRFGHDAVSRITTRAGLPLAWNRRYRHAGLATAAVRDDLPARRLFSPDNAPTGTHHGLVVSDAAHAEVCTIRGLTLGEARWMKGRLQAAGVID